MPVLARLAAPGAALALALTATSCTSPDTFAPPCPSVALLKEGADHAEYAGPGRDITNLLMAARITSVSGTCRTQGPDNVKAIMQVGIMFAHGPAASSRNVSVPYFVAVTRNQQILEKHEYTAVATFPSNVDRVSVVSPDINMVLPVTANDSAASYRIFVSFTLTPEELDFNRRNPQQ